MLCNDYSKIAIKTYKTIIGINDLNYSVESFFIPFNIKENTTLYIPAIIKNTPIKLTIVIAPAKGRKIIHKPKIMARTPQSKPNHQLGTPSSFRPKESVNDVIP